MHGYMVTCSIFMSNHLIVSPVDSAVGGHGRGRPGVGVAVVGGRLVLGIEVGVEEGLGRVSSVVISIRKYRGQK